MKRLLNTLVVVIAICALSTAAFAGTQATNTNTVSPTLQISATIQKAVQLTLSTGTAAIASHCAVAPGGNPPDYTMDFGNVDALGINAGNCNKFAPATPGTSNAVYWSDYNLTPIYTSQSGTSASSITAYVSTNFANGNIGIVRSSTANSSAIPAGVASFANMSTAVGAQDTIANAADMTAAGNGGTLTRFIGVSVAPTNGAGLAGATSATVTFTMTIN
ncbi:MAG TPA: hypothetical protein VKW06_15075 [Candidatus Angelobacter sp.]|nr:hypothetical protein [Candidatus Angelobacter sp.]